jgi:hypothetical protein
VSVADVARGVSISAAQAKAEAGVIGSVRDSSINTTLIDQTARMEEGLIELTNNATVLTKVSEGVVSTMEVIVKTEKKVSDAIDAIKRRL